MWLKTFFLVLKDAFDAWSEDKAPRLGAALAYYAIFSVAPLLLVLIGLAGLLYGPQAARGEVVNEVNTAVGQTAAEAIQDLLKHADNAKGSTLAAVVGFVMLL